MAQFLDPYEQAVSGTEDRLRAILRISRTASLPKVNATTMLAYYDYLSSRLMLPCEARYCAEDGTVYPVTVTDLVDPGSTPCDPRVGLCCVANFRNRVESLPLLDMEVEHDSPNFQMIEDYWFWLWNWRESRRYAHSKPR